MKRELFEVLRDRFFKVSVFGFGERSTTQHQFDFTVWLRRLSSFFTGLYFIDLCYKLLNYPFELTVIICRSLLKSSNVPPLYMCFLK